MLELLCFKPAVRTTAIQPVASIAIKHG